MNVKIQKWGIIMKLNEGRTPDSDSYHMPAEYEKHSGCIMIWPKREGSFPFGCEPARKAFCSIVLAIAQSERVHILVDDEQMLESVAGRREFSDTGILKGNESYDLRAAAGGRLNNTGITIDIIRSDDAWARDTAPTFVVNNNCKKNNDMDLSFEKKVRGVDWKFNAWGGETDGLYKDFENDDRIAGRFCNDMNIDYYDAHPFVLEGGSIHSDGMGTLIATESCLLSKGRNPDLSKEQIERKLKNYLGAKKIIWLPHGIFNDETNEHVDNVCAFAGPATVVLAWSDDENDPQYGYSMADFKVLEKETDACGRKFKIVKLNVPEKPVCINEQDLAGFAYEDGEKERSAGERLAASYANFYISNGAVIVPQFGDANDTQATEIFKKLFPERKVIPVMTRDILLGGGNIHCLTQQIPG